MRHILFISLCLASLASTAQPNKTAKVKKAAVTKNGLKAGVKVSYVANANNPAASLYSLGVKVNNAAAGEEFKFRLRSGARLDSLTIRSPNTTANFPTKIAPGQQYIVTQTSGPRTCELTNYIGTISKNTIVTAACGLPPSNHKIGVAYSSGLMSVYDRFEFELSGGERIVIDTGHKVVYFSQIFQTGQSYRVRQVSGTRTCTFAYIGVYGSSEAEGVITNSDVLIRADFPTPPLSIITMNITGIKTGEMFIFSDTYGRTHYIPFSLTTSLGGFPIGDPWIITQVGPRPCVITPASGVVPNSPLTIQCDCRKPPGSAPDSSLIRGFLRGKAGTVITLQTNGANDLTVTASIEGTYFTFPTPLPDGSAYNVTVKSAPPDQQYVVKTYAGEPGIVSGSSYVTVYGDLQYDLISRDSSNTLSSFYESSDPSVDKEMPEEDFRNRNVVFISQAKGLCGSSGQYRQIFWRDRLTGDTRMISRSPNGEEGNGNSFAPSLLAGSALAVGQLYVAFESYATNLVDNDRNGVRDVFLWTKTYKGDGVERISVGPGSVEGNGESFEPSVTGMGDVAFSSNATNLVGDGVEVSGVNVYLWENHSKRTTLISKDPITGKGVGGSKPSIDMSGYKIAFWSFANTLVPEDNNNLWDIFLYERNTSFVGLPLRRITMAYDGGERNQGDESSSRIVAPTISGDGRFITYATTASNVVPGDNNNVQDVFVYDSENNSTIRASVDNNGVEGNAASPIGQGERIDITVNGSKVVFTTAATNFGVPANNVMLYDLNLHKLTPVTAVTGTYVSTPSISRNGRYVIFGCGLPLDSRFTSSGLFAAFVAAGY